MFDFNCYILTEPYEGQENPWLSEQYLENISYEKKHFSGKNFQLTSLAHSLSNTPYYHEEENIYVFLMGTAYTNFRISGV